MNDPAANVYPGRSEPLALWQLALADHVAGRRDLLLRLVDRSGQSVVETFSQYFQEEHQLSPIDRRLVREARGRVLDVGAGAGRHALPLQRAGHAVVAIDTAPLAVSLMRDRGLDARLADIRTFAGETFDTILLAGHNIGIAGTLGGLDRLLDRFASLLAPGGCVLLDSIDLPPGQPRYDTFGHFLGEAMLHLEYGDRRGPEFPWLCIDFDTLHQHAGCQGWTAARLATEPDGDYLARLDRS